MNKRKLYENIINGIAKEVKKAINERIYNNLNMQTFFLPIYDTLVKDILDILKSHNIKYDLTLPNENFGEYDRDQISIFVCTNDMVFVYDDKNQIIRDKKGYAIHDIEKEEILKNNFALAFNEIILVLKNYNYKNSGITIVKYYGAHNWFLDISYIGAKLYKDDIPEYVYHICDKCDVDSILKNGLKINNFTLDNNIFEHAIELYNDKKSFNILYRPYNGIFAFANKPTAIKEYQKMYSNKNRWELPVILKINAKAYNWYEDNVMDDFLSGTRYKKQYVQSLVTFENIDPNDISLL